MLSQIKASECERLRLKLENILISTSDNVTVLKNSDLIIQMLGRPNGAPLIIEDAERLLEMYIKYSNLTNHSPVISVRLNDYLKKYSSGRFAKALNSVINSKLAVVEVDSLSNISNINNVEDADCEIIDNLRLEHIQSHSKLMSLLNRCQKLQSQREELLAKFSSVHPAAQLHGLIAKRQYLEKRLTDLKSQSEKVISLKMDIQESAKFSSEFDQKLSEKKARLKSINSLLESLRKSTVSIRSKTLESYNKVLQASNRLSSLITDFHNSSNSASSAAMYIVQCMHNPKLSICIVPPLYNELCKKISCAPYITPIDKVYDRINSIISDCGSVGLINDELMRSLATLKSLRDSLRTFLETSRNAEKEVCIAMAGLLKKISVHCAKVAQKQRHLESIWSYWSEYAPQDENHEYSLEGLGIG